VTTSAPDPHEHHYNPEFDELEGRLIARDWRRVLPLREEDATTAAIVCETQVADNPLVFRVQLG
jgi:hypothetical protein